MSPLPVTRRPFAAALCRRTGCDYIAIASRGEPLHMPVSLRHGRYHDLEAIKQHLCREYFPTCQGVTIGWGRWSGRARPRSIRFGVYLSETRLIRIHPALDQVFVPRFFVEFIVYHELLHDVMPPRLVKGRYQIHTTAFRQREQAFPTYTAALSWRKRHLHRLLVSNGMVAGKKNLS
jgi:hypothetical protein